MLYIYNQAEQLVAILNNDGNGCPYYDAVHVEKLNGENTFSFSMPADSEEAAYVHEGALVAFQDSDTYWQIFEIQRIEDIHDSSGIIRNVYSEHISYQLLNDIITDKRPYNTTAENALASALESTRWEVGTVYDFGTNSTNFYYENVLSAIQKIANTWGGELNFRVTMVNNSIDHLYVDILDHRGAQTGKSFAYSKDIVEIQKNTDISDVYTAVYGRGKGEEITNAEGESTYTRRIDFADVVWSTANGDPADKPIGQEYVEDTNAKLLWGRNSLNRFGIYSDDGETDPELLLQKTWEYLQEHNSPLITYSLNVLDLEKLSGYEHEAVRLGDEISIQDGELGIDVIARVIEIDRNYTDPEDTKVVLGNFRKDISDEAVIQANINKTVSDRSGIWDKANAFDSNGKLGTEWLEGIIDTLQNQVNAGNGTVTITDDNGILIVDDPDNPTAALRLLGGVFAIANSKLPGGAWDWRTFGTGDGFTADEINTGKIRTALVNIFGDTNFVWDADGIKAYNPLNNQQWIKFNKDGLVFTLDNGATYDFSLTWAGLNIGNITKDMLDQEVQDALNNRPILIDEDTTAYFPFDNSITSTRGMNPTFTRNSIAYKSDGTQVATNVPRFEQGQFGQAIMIEEGTTNLLTAPKDFTKSAWSKGNVIVTADATTAPNGLQEADKLEPTAVNGNVFQTYSIDPANESFTFSVWLKADIPHYALIKVQNNDNTEYTDKRVYVTTSWQRFDVTKSFTLTGKTGVKVIIWPGDYNGTTDYVYAWGAQLEQKPYATSFIDGTRAAESLTIPTAGVLNPQEGTVECWVNPYVVGGRIFIAGPNPWDSNKSLQLFIESSGKWRFTYGYGTYYTTLSGSTAQTGTWAHLAIRWNSSGGALFVNGTKQAELSTPPVLQLDQCYIGSWYNGTQQLNCLIDDLRISSRARTDEEIAAAYNSNNPFLDPLAANNGYVVAQNVAQNAVMQNVQYNNVQINSTVGVKATHATGEYTQLYGGGLKHFVSTPIYTSTPTGVPNTEGFESGTLPSNWDIGQLDGTAYISMVQNSVKHTGNYALRLSNAGGWGRVEFFITKDNTAVSFYYYAQNQFLLIIDGGTTYTISDNATWQQYTLYLNKGGHSISFMNLNKFDYDLYEYPQKFIYLDDFIYEQSPVSYSVSGYNPSVGYSYAYRIYVGEYTTTYSIEKEGADIVKAANKLPVVWITLPEEFKNKNFQIFLSPSEPIITTEGTGSSLAGIACHINEIRNDIPAFSVTAFTTRCTDYYAVRGLRFNYMVVI